MPLKEDENIMTKRFLSWLRFIKKVRQLQWKYQQKFYLSLNGSEQKTKKNMFPIIGSHDSLKSFSS